MGNAGFISSTFVGVIVKRVAFRRLGCTRLPLAFQGSLGFWEFGQGLRALALALSGVEVITIRALYTCHDFISWNIWSLRLGTLWCTVQV